MMKKPITSFRNEYMFLSNFYPVQVKLDGKTYPSVEAAFQAAKTLDPLERVPFETMGPEAAKRAGRKLTLRPDWEDAKDGIMLALLRSKFSDPELRDRLVKLGMVTLVEGNTWHDNYWGNCTCPKCGGIKGQNKLGKLLMQVKHELADQVLAEYDQHSMNNADIKARSVIKQYYQYLISRSAAEPQNEDLIHEMDSIAHLIMGGCGDQYIVMAQEAAARGFDDVIDIGCDLGWACHYFYAYDLGYTGIERQKNIVAMPAPCTIHQLTYPTPITSVMEYDRDTTVAVSSLCVGWFEPVEEQLAQLAKDFKFAMVTVNDQIRPVAEKYFTATDVDQDICFLESRI